MFFLFKATSTRHQKTADVAIGPSQVSGSPSIRALDALRLVQWTCSCHEL